jgi:hypothetical protein
MVLNYGVHGTKLLLVRFSPNPSTNTSFEPCRRIKCRVAKSDDRYKYRKTKSSSGLLFIVQESIE